MLKKILKLFDESEVEIGCKNNRSALEYHRKAKISTLCCIVFEKGLYLRIGRQEVTVSSVTFSSVYTSNG